MHLMIKRIIRQAYSLRFTFLIAKQGFTLARDGGKKTGQIHIRDIIAKLKILQNVDEIIHTLPYASSCRRPRSICQACCGFVNVGISCYTVESKSVSTCNICCFAIQCPIGAIDHCIGRYVRSAAVSKTKSRCYYRINVLIYTF